MTERAHRTKSKGSGLRLAGCLGQMTLALLLPAATSCKEGASPPNPVARGALVGFVGAGQDDPLWPVLRASAERFLAELGGKMKVRFDAPPRRSPHQQNQLIRQLLDEQVGALCVQVVDSVLIAPVIEQAHRRGVPVYTMVHDAAQNHRAAFVGLDERAIGLTLAETALNSIDGQANIAAVHAGGDHPLYGRRWMAFDQTIRTQSRIRVLKRLNCNDDPRAADQMLRDLLERYPSLKAVVLMANWPFLLPEGRPLAVPTGCRLISVGATPEFWKYLDDGPLFALIGADYGQIGFEALMFCRTAGEGTSIIPRVDFEHVPIRVVWAITLGKFKQDWSEWSRHPSRR